MSQSSAAVIVRVDSFSHRSGFCFLATGMHRKGDSVETPAASNIRLFEDGQEIGPAHILHREIEELGRGRFSHWGDTLYFSSSDGSSPKQNKRSYHALFEPEASASRTALEKATFLAIQSGVLKYPYKGIWCCKNPIDMALYQMLIWREKPRTILELGSLEGGSALWFADIFRSFGIDGHIHSIDISPIPSVADPLVTFHRGDVLDLTATWPLEWIASLPRPILLIDDAGHQYELSKAALDYGAAVLRTGEYLIVEDGIATPMGQDSQFNGGPLRAIDEFLSARKEFAVDREYLDFFGTNVTWNTDGYLRRV